MEGGGDERVFRTFDLGWGYFDIDVQAGEGEDEHLEVADGEVLTQLKCFMLFSGVPWGIPETFPPK